jgi:hypothetical protein
MALIRASLIRLFAAVVSLELVRGDMHHFILLHLSGLLRRHISARRRGPSSGQSTRFAGWYVVYTFSRVCLWT